jgi:hypothetical protein
MKAAGIVLSQADSRELVATARSLFREYAQAIRTDLEYQGFTVSSRFRLATQRICRAPAFARSSWTPSDEDSAGGWR